MRRLQLYIGTERVDLFKDESVSLTQTIKNVKDLAKVFTEFTQTFSVPASSVNNKIFQHYYNFDISGGFDARIKADARLELNDLPFKDGKIALQGVELKNNLAHTYKITFYGNTVNLKDMLGDSELGALPLNQNQIYDYADVKARMQSSSNDILVPLITHTNRLIYNSGSHNTFDPEATTNNIYPHGSGTSHQNGVDWKQFKYAIRLQAIIVAIQTRYNITFSDDFFNDNTNEKFYNLFMWLHRKSGDVETPAQVEVIYTRLDDLVVKTGSDEEISTVSNGVITINATGVRQPLFLRYTLDPIDNTAVYNVRVLRNGGTVVGELNGVNDTQLLEISISNGLLNNSTYTLEISGVGVSFAANDIDVSLIFSRGVGIQPGTDTYHNNASFQTNQDFEFNIAEQIPKIKIIDFISGLFNLFNLTAYVNDVGTIVVRTLDSYYADSTQVYNIDKYLDTTKSTSDVALPFKEINFSYKGLGTFLAKQFNQLTNSGWGSLSYTLDGDIFDAPSEPYKIEVPFEHMQFERLYDIGTSPRDATNVQWGYSVNESQQPYIGSPLLFYPIYISNGTNIRIRDAFDLTKVDDINDYFIPSNSLALLPSTSKENIHFQNELNEYLANEPDGLVGGDNALGFTDTLFQTDYREYIQDVFNLRRRLIKVTAYLPMKVYYNLQLNDLIQLGQDSYKINSMKTDLTTGKTEFELLNTIL